MDNINKLHIFCLVVIVLLVSVSFGIKVIKKDKVLVLYYSYDDPIEGIAKTISEETNGKLKKIESSSSYENFEEDAYDELVRNEYPSITVGLSDLDKYDTVYIGYPIWFNNMPRVMYTLFEKYDFDGKKINIFYYSDDKKGQWTVGEIMQLENKAYVNESINITNDDIKNKNEVLSKWIKEIS